MRTSEKLAAIGSSTYIPDESDKRDENGIRVRPTVKTKKAFVGIAEYVGVDPAVLGKIVIDRFVDAFMSGKITREEFLFGRD
jgi:hypothetical protein